MVNRNLIRSLESDPELNSAFEAEVSELTDPEQMYTTVIEADQEVNVNDIVKGTIIRIDEEAVLVDIGFKSEGTIPLYEWEEEEERPEVGQVIDVLVEEVEDELGLANDPHGMVSVSKRKADKIREWDRVMNEVEEGQVITGTVTRKIKGGLLVDIGVPVFLPASQG